jgi:hypothetical protein
MLRGNIAKCSPIGKLVGQSEFNVDSIGRQRLVQRQNHPPSTGAKIYYLQRTGLFQHPPQKRQHRFVQREAYFQKPQVVQGEIANRMRKPFQIFPFE